MLGSVREVFHQFFVFVFHRLPGTGGLPERLFRFHPESMSPACGVRYHAGTHVVEKVRVRLCVLFRRETEKVRPSRAGRERNTERRGTGQALRAAADVENWFES